MTTNEKTYSPTKGIVTVVQIATVATMTPYILSSLYNDESRWPIYLGVLVIVSTLISLLTNRIGRGSLFLYLFPSLQWFSITLFALMTILPVPFIINENGSWEALSSVIIVFRTIILNFVFLVKHKGWDVFE